MSNHYRQIHDDEDLIGENLEATHCMHMLQTCEHIAGRQRGDFRVRRATHEDCLALLNAIRLSRRLAGGAAQVYDVLERSVEVLLGGRAALANHQGDFDRVRSSATMQRHELTLDIALMLSESQRFHRHSQVVRWAWTDSSPQQKKDWVWHQFLEIPIDALSTTFAAVTSLTQAMEGLSDTEVCDIMLEVPAAWTSWLDAIKRNIRYHVTPPTAVGSGHRGLVHKASALLHSHYMEVHDVDKLKVELFSLFGKGWLLVQLVSSPNEI